MHTELNAMIIQQQPNHPQNHTQHQQNYNTLAQDHPMVEHNQQQQAFNHFPSRAMEMTTSLSEEFYNPTPQQHLTSECHSQYYSATLKHDFPTMSSGSSSSSSSSSSSDESNCTYSRRSANKMYRNNNGKNATSIGVNLRVTGQCSQGGRKYMEDYFTVAYQQSDNANDLEYAFIGIYDGHGGAEAAKFAKEHLMLEIINQKLFWSDNDHDILRAIREGYIATHYSMWREQDKWPKTANGLPSTAGTTATVAFIRREKIYIGHVGDSGIVLGYQNENEKFWRAKQLTTDHKPESIEERTRIMNSGGKVVVKSGVPRVVWNRPRNASHRGPIRKKTLVDEIPFLAVARSLGDLWSYNSERNEFVVSPDPDVQVIPIDPNTFRCLIFGTDGLWNVVSAQEAVNTVRDKEAINERLLAQRGNGPIEGNQWTNPSKSLVEQALRTWSHKKMRADNTSVVTVILHPPSQVDNGNDHNVYNEANIVQSNTSSFVEHINYGLKYTQVQAEVPPQEIHTTYKEMALKYLPPEAYRNFNYYADEDSDTDDNDNEDAAEEHNATVAKPTEELQQTTNFPHHYSSAHDWNWQQNDVNTFTKPKDDEHEDDGDDEDETEENVIQEKSSTNERLEGAIEYQNYIHMEAEETNNATDSYINTFAESYNTILTGSQDCLATATACSSTSSLSNSSNSNSNSNCQSVTPPNMHAILEEQQLYQQQCMSEEEGYSLTKLETRREQQTCKDHSRRAQLTNESNTPLQTFKLFQQPAVDVLQLGTLQANTDRFYPQQQQQQQFMQQMLPKPLELHSLLQQEREEEQQVAYERLQMANELQQQQQNISTYACLQPPSSSMVISLQEQPPVEVEFMEADSPVRDDHIIATNNLCFQQDESVQIHEVSSSSFVEESLRKPNCDEIYIEPVEVIEKIEILPNFEITKEDEPMEGKSEVDCIVQPPVSSPEKSICPPPTPQTTQVPPKLVITPLRTSSSQSKRTKAAYLYNNVPNENLQRISNSKCNHSRFTPTGSLRNNKRSMCLTPSVNMTPPAATSTPITQRQLRSTATSCSNTTTTIIDYSKRTLRTRNSLSKDLKAKNSLVQASLKYPQNNAVTRNFIRTTAGNLVVAKPLHINELTVTPCSIRPNRSSIRTRNEKTSNLLNLSLNQQSKANKQNSAHSQLNLRSRQTPPSPASSSGHSTNSLRNTSTTSTPVIKRACLTSERRILRSTHTRGTSTKSSQTPANFSKSTRTQSSGSNLAAPPPSPKLINSVAAVAAATRARSLLNAKHVAAVNGTQSVVSAVFGKRSSPRCNGNTHPAARSNSNATLLTTPVSAQQTLRGRIVKKLKR